MQQCTYKSNQSTVSEAAAFCSSKNTSLLSVESIAEMLCLLKLIPPSKNELCTTSSVCNFNTAASIGSQYKTFMTSGSNEGASCEVQGVYNWCTSGNTLLLPDLIKMFLKPTANASHERCVALNASSNTDNSSALTHVSCAGKQFPFICEPLCIQATCPLASVCAKNVINIIKKKKNEINTFLSTQASLFGSDSKVKGMLLNKMFEVDLENIITEPKLFGMWMETCGDTYLFGNKPVK
jgi:Lectin C-type domain